MQRAVGALLVAGLGLLVAGAAQAAVTWTDVTGAAGVDFQLAGALAPDGGVVWPAFPEVMSGGACWGDFDNDGYEDLFLVNQVYNTENPGAGDWAADLDPHSQLYANRGDGTFLDITAQAGLNVRGWGYGCSAADYDADGWLDLFVANFGDNMLFRNNGDGSFANVSASSGVDMVDACGEFLCMSTSSAWADYDLDGDLDLYVDNYVETHTADHRRGPANHVGQPNFLHRNNGDGTFTEVATEAGAAGEHADAHGSKSLGVIWFDYDLDGWMDIYVANDEVEANLYHNQGDGTFVELAITAGVADDRANMGLAIEDYDQDGLPDIYITHYQGELAGFYRNNGDGTFEDRSGEEALGYTQFVGWSTRFVDYDRDMDLDLLQVNGHTEVNQPNADTLEAWHDQPSAVWRNDASGDPDADPWDRTWADAAPESGSGISDRHVSRGAAWADYDLDGDMDVAIVNNANQTAVLLEAAGVANHWLQLELRQPGGNPWGVGARVALEAGGVTQHRALQAGSGYLAQSTRLLDFGLGSNAEAERVTITWPDGGSTTLLGLAADQVLRVDRATGTVTNDTLAPRTAIVRAGEASGAWYLSPVGVSLDVQDLGATVPSGVARSDHRLDGGAWQVWPGGTLTITEQGQHAIEARSLDAAGNLEPTRSDTVWIDTTAPEATHDVDGVLGQEAWYVSDPVTVTVHASDAVSGVDQIRYRIDGGAWQETAAGTFEVSEDGVHLVEYEVEDVAGNTSPVTSFELRVDAHGPEVALLRPVPGGVYLGPDLLATLGVGPAVVLAMPGAEGLGGTTLPVEASASDGASGVLHVTFFLDGRLVAVDRDGPAYGFAWEVGSAAAGHYQLEAIAVDRAGNVDSTAVGVVVVPATEEGLARTLLDGPSLPPDFEPGPPWPLTAPSQPGTAAGREP